MKRAVLLNLVFSILIAPASAAQLYRWVDEKGTVEWRDTPPPPTAKRVEQRSVGAARAPEAELPYGLQQPMRNFPVTLWITNCGETCDKARAHLARRGVPYTEKNPEDNAAAFKRETGGSEVPVLFVGRMRAKGYLESEWDATLDAAGYPRTALVAIKPKPAPASAAPQKPAPADAAVVRLYTNSQCGPSCEEAKKLLTGRGVAFQEIAADTPTQMDELKRLSGVTAVPVLVVGRLFVQGFNSVEYNRLLDESGYRAGQ
jgi:glutaredoxin